MPYFSINKVRIVYGYSKKNEDTTKWVIAIPSEKYIVKGGCNKLEVGKHQFRAIWFKGFTTEYYLKVHQKLKKKTIEVLTLSIKFHNCHHANTD